MHLNVDAMLKICKQINGDCIDMKNTISSATAHILREASALISKRRAIVEPRNTMV